MMPYARLTPGKGFQPARALLYYAQRAVTTPGPRRVCSSLIAAGVKARHGDGALWAPSEDHARVIEDLHRDGLAHLAPAADDQALAGIVDHFQDQPVLDGSGREVALESLDAPTAAAYRLPRILDCPGMLDLLNDPAILRIASDYIGCKPTLSSVGVRWSFPTGGPPARTQSFHRDIDDWRFLKLFVYLTDVDETSGPHCYVRTSHNSAFGLSAKSYTQAEVEERFGADKLTTIVGRRGTTFIADTLGVHRGVAPLSRPRLILQAQYSVLPIYAFNYAPLGLSASSRASYSNRLILRGPREDRRAGLFAPATGGLTTPRAAA